MRVRIGDVSLYFDADGRQLVPYGPDMVERPTVIGLHGVPGADHSLFNPVLGDVTASVARRLASELPGVRPHAPPGAGHGIFREDSERACALLQEFLMGNRVDANARVS
jgi:hypothetical protein